MTENQTLFLDTLLYLHITYNGIVYILSSKILIERKTKYLIIDSVLYWGFWSQFWYKVYIYVDLQRPQNIEKQKNFQSSSIILRPNLLGLKRGLSNGKSIYRRPTEEILRFMKLRPACPLVAKDWFLKILVLNSVRTGRNLADMRS